VFGIYHSGQMLPGSTQIAVIQDTLWKSFGRACAQKRPTCASNFRKGEDLKSLAKLLQKAIKKIIVPIGPLTCGFIKHLTFHAIKLFKKLRLFENMMQNFPKTLQVFVHGLFNV